MSRAITSFSGEYTWLSNFSPAHVELDGVIYPTVEHAYQAAKFRGPGMREQVRICRTPGQAKRKGQSAKLDVAAWDAKKEFIMYGLLQQKFAKPGLFEKLLATGDAELIEGNAWHDTYWGVCNGEGQNRLGALLMKIRGEMK